MSVPTEKLGSASFAENIRLFANLKTDKEKYNLYAGLWAMSGEIAALRHTVHKLEMQLNTVALNLMNISVSR